LDSGMGLYLEGSYDISSLRAAGGRLAEGSRLAADPQGQRIVLNGRDYYFFQVGFQAYKNNNIMAKGKRKYGDIYKNFHGKKVFQHDFGGFIEYGNYIKTRFTIFQGKSVFVQHHFSYLTDWDWVEDHPGEEPRMVQIADLELNSRQKLRLINYRFQQHFLKFFFWNIV